MDLTIFLVLLALALTLITLGLFKSEHTELSLIGFVFLFLLSIALLNGNVVYATGTSKNYTYAYNYPSVCGVDVMTLNSSTETSSSIYSPFSVDGVLSHIIGYWLAIASVIGFLGIILSMRGQRFIT